MRGNTIKNKKTELLLFEVNKILETVQAANIQMKEPVFSVRVEPNEVNGKASDYDVEISGNLKILSAEHQYEQALKVFNYLVLLK